MYGIVLDRCEFILLRRWARSEVVKCQSVDISGRDDASK